MADSHVHHRTCSLCEAMCGIEITHDKGKVLSIKGDSKDPLSKGFICPKAVALQDIHDDPDRLRYPMLKTPQGWERISWENAFNETAARLRSIQAKYGKNSVGVYLGNPTVHNHGSLLTIFPFLNALDTENRFSATSVDQLAPMLASLKMFGNQTMLPIPDIDRCEHFVCIGANPMASNGGLMSAPGFKKRIQKLQARGGKLITIDPRKTETAAIADEHFFVKPGSDALLLMAIVHTLFRLDLVNLGKAQNYTQGINILRNMILGFSPEKVAPLVGIEAEEIRRIACEFANAEHACFYGRMGTSTQSFGGISSWLIYVINIITGNMDSKGGMMFTHPAIDLTGLGQLFGENGTFNTRSSRVRRLPEFNGEFPAVTMADEMLTPGNGQIKAMVLAAGNPVLSVPNGNKVDQGLAQMEFVVAIDFYMNESTQHADIILPPTGPLEHGHYDLIFNGLAVRNVTKYAPPLFSAAPDTRHDWQIFLELTRRLESRSPISWAKSEVKYQILKNLGDEGLLDLLLRTGPYGSQVPKFQDWQERLVDLLYDRLSPRSAARLALDLSPYSYRTKDRSHHLSLKKLLKSPHGIDIGALNSCLPERLATKNKQINLVPKIYLKDVSRLQRQLDNNLRRSSETFYLIGRRHIRSNNSWLHNSERLVKGKNRCTALIHPEDAARLSIEEGDVITVSSRSGEIEISAEITANIMPSVISIPHGWGHHRAGAMLSVASQHAGVSINDVTDERLVDELTGVAALSGQPVTVSKIKKQENIVRLNDKRIESDANA
ncbi:MAG: molybdopterin oxidoreductase family protein [Pseudomonadales bacterium]|nr:molybdopterin oxidoreductase family protein [Pseudomonadales bacterium]